MSEGRKMKLNFIPAKGSLFSLLAAAIIFTNAPLNNSHAQVPIESDSRIKTVIYNENEVYTFITRHGFQSNIEFGQDENIETISIGDAIGWQVTPAGRRIFVKPLQRNGITNLTVITNRHSYQFELVATDSRGSGSNHAYVLRFFYPEYPGQMITAEDRTRGDLRPVSPTPIPELPTPPMYSPGMPPMPPTLPGESSVAAPLTEIPVTDQSLNFNYTLTGPAHLSPTKIYDDGRSTFFELPNSAAGNLEFAVVTADGMEKPVMARQEGGMMVIDQIAGKFTIRKDGQLICVFNEKILSLPPTASIGPGR